MNTVWYWLETFRYVFGPISIISGVFLFLSQHEHSSGVKFLTFFIITLIFTIMLIMTLSYIFLTNTNSKNWVGWVIFATGVFLGLPL